MPEYQHANTPLIQLQEIDPLYFIHAANRTPFFFKPIMLPIAKSCADSYKWQQREIYGSGFHL